MKIPALYRNINTSLLPQIIKDKLTDLSGEYITRFRDENRNLLPEPINIPTLPIFYEKRIKDIEFYIPSYVEKDLDNLKDFEGNPITTKKCYLYEYGKGFINGYRNFENDINTNDLLEPDKLEKANRIIGFLFDGFFFGAYWKKGQVIEHQHYHPKIIKVEKEINGKKQIVNMEDNSGANFYVTKDDFYNAGYEAGKYYRALKTVLNYPILFEPLFKKYFEKKERENPLFDFSNTKATEKIIMLHKLGILDFLREKEPFNMSINSLASALSGITGEKPETLQSYLNPIYSSYTSQKNNPLTSQKSNIKVLEKLKKLGFRTK